MDPNLVNELHRIDQDVLKTGYKDTTQLINTAERQGFNNEARNHRNTQHILTDIHNTASRNLAATERRGSEAVSAVQQATGLLDTDIYRVANQIDNNTYRTAHDINDNVYRTQAEIARTSSILALETQKVTNEILGRMTDDYRVISSDLSKITSDIQSSKGDVLLQQANIYGNLSRQFAEQTAHIEVESLKNRACIEKNMADYHGDLKSNLVASEMNIKELIKGTEAERIRDKLRETENKSLFFELKDSHGHHGHHGGHRHHH